MNSRAKMLKISDESVVRELLEESDDDLSSFSEIVDTDEDNTYLPPNSSNDNQSSNGKYNYYIIYQL